MIITLDGPAGVGKSTLARKLAQHFNIPCLDTGAMYRSIALKLGASIADMSDKKLQDALTHFSFSLCPITSTNSKISPKNDAIINDIDTHQNIEYELCLNDSPVREEIRTEKVGRLAAIVASLPLVRTALQKFQREIGENTPLVTEGRDMGTSVFPYATVKFFLDARAEVRAKRRCLEMQAKTPEISVHYEEILLDITERDTKDRNRTIDPLKPASDAIIVDTSDLSQEEVFEKLIYFIEEKMQLSSQNIKQLAIQRLNHLEIAKQKNRQKSNTQKSNSKNSKNNTVQAIGVQESNFGENLEFSHLSKDGSLSMVSVEHKPHTLRKALAYGFVRMTKHTINLLKTQALPKGDVLSVAKVAGIMAAKHTANSIPLCHPILLSYVDIRFNVQEDGVAILAEVHTNHNTGVEMEAIMAVQITAATIYDMVKAVQKDMIIENVHLLYKEGGKTLFKAQDYSQALLEQFL